MSKDIDGFVPLEINHGNKGRKAWYTERIEQLEQLCRDLWTCAHEPKCCNCPKYLGEDTDCEVLNAQRMDALGLLEGDSHE